MTSKFILKYSKSIVKTLKKLDSSICKQILSKLKQLENNAYLGNPLSSKFKNFRSLHINKYRVIYKINKNVIFILKIGFRKNIYSTTINKDNLYLNENKKRLLYIIRKSINYF